MVMKTNQSPLLQGVKLKFLVNLQRTEDILRLQKETVAGETAGIM